MSKYTVITNQSPQLSTNIPQPFINQGNTVVSNPEFEKYSPTGQYVKTTPTVSPLNPKWDRRKSPTPSRFNEPLNWYDTAGNLMAYMESLDREPVALDQLRITPLQTRQFNPLPTLLQNQGDYDAAIEQLPDTGVGYANQANLLANKYKVNNEILGQTANQNMQLANQTDQYNDNIQRALQTANLNLKDSFTNKILQAKEAQRQSKLLALDNLFTKIAQNRKLNREGQLVLNLNPYFDQNGQFNYQDYAIIPNTSTGMYDIYDKETNTKTKTITSQQYDKMNQLKGTKKTQVVTR